jgi:AcrR family transcriptional regulator
LKYVNLLRVTRLLNSREAVSLKEIMNICGVSRATAYRYLRTIADTGIPVEYNQETRSYTIVQRPPLTGLGLELNDLLIVCFAVALLARSLDDTAAQFINKVLASLSAGQQLPVDNIVLSVPEMLDRDNLSPKIRTALNLFLIQAAGIAKRSIAVHLNGSINRTLELNRPAIRMGSDWVLSGENHGSAVDIPLSRILHVTVY